MSFNNFTLPTSAFNHTVNAPLGTSMYSIPSSAGDGSIYNVEVKMTTHNLPKMDEDIKKLAVAFEELNNFIAKLKEHVTKSGDLIQANYVQIGILKNQFDLSSVMNAAGPQNLKNHEYDAKIKEFDDKLEILMHSMTVLCEVNAAKLNEKSV